LFLQNSDYYEKNIFLERRKKILFSCTQLQGVKDNPAGMIYRRVWQMARSCTAPWPELTSTFQPFPDISFPNKIMT